MGVSKLQSQKKRKIMFFSFLQKETQTLVGSLVALNGRKTTQQVNNVSSSSQDFPPIEWLFLSTTPINFQYLLHMISPDLIQNYVSGGFNFYKTWVFWLRSICVSCSNQINTGSIQTNNSKIAVFFWLLHTQAHVHPLTFLFVYFWTSVLLFLCEIYCQRNNILAIQMTYTSCRKPTYPHSPEFNCGYPFVQYTRQCAQ